MFDEHTRDCVISVKHNCNYGPASYHLEDRASDLSSSGVMRFYD
jgi:hypothetical protein